MKPLTPLPRWLLAPWWPGAVVVVVMAAATGRFADWYGDAVGLAIAAAPTVLALGVVIRVAQHWLVVLDGDRDLLRHTLDSTLAGVPGTLALSEDVAPHDELDSEMLQALRPVGREYAVGDRFVQDIRFPILAGDRLLGIGRHLTDVTDQRHVRDEADLAVTQSQSFLDAAPDATLMVDSAGVIRYANPQVAVLLGYFVDELVDSQVEMLVPEALRQRHIEHRRGYEAQPSRRPMGRREDLTARHRDGREIPVDISISPIIGEDGTWTLVFLRDAMARRATEQALRDAQERYRHLAEHDPLTGLMNRRRFEAELEAHLASCRRSGARGTLLSLDLDHFKGVNDTLGHHVGDQLVTAVAHTLRATMRDSDPVARQGGDEFLVLVREGGEVEASAIAARLLEAVAEAAGLLSDVEIQVSGSVGAVVLRNMAVEDLTAEATMIAADIALYAAKYAGRGRAVLHHELEAQGTTGPVLGDMSV